MRTTLHQVGVTADGRRVYGGVFAMYDTHGLPLDVLFGEALRRGHAIAWLDFYDDALRAGWKRKRILDAIDYGLRDAVHPELADVVRARLDQLRP